MIRSQSIELTLEEIEEVKEYAERMKHLKPVDQHRDLLSAFGAELAFAKITGAEHNFSVDRDWRYDCIWNGYYTDVKYTLLENNYLLTEKSAADNNDLVEIYIHMKGKMPYFEYWGWKTKDELVVPENNVKVFDGRKDKIPYSIHESQLSIYPPTTERITVNE